MGIYRIVYRDLCLTLIASSLFLLLGCSTTYKATNPLYKQFPKVEAEVLSGGKVEIPTVFNEKDTLMLIGFVQNSQFDIDRWILGLKQLKTPISIVEIPTIKGVFPRIISNAINQGMKDGIPEEDWKVVFTVYKGASEIVEFLGNEKPLNARVVLVDKDGVVQWFHDRGYSADKVTELDLFVRERALAR